MIDVNKNKQEFIDLIKTNIKREGVEALLSKLEKSDFYTAPASTKYHLAVEGGLCQHCLNVYKRLKTLIKMEYPTEVPDENGEMKQIDSNCPYTDESIAIVALLHDLSKMNFYEKYVMNKKVYSENGTKRDEMGKFDWVAEQAFKVKDAKDRFLFGSHSINSFYMVGALLPLQYEEELAIMYHMGGKDNSYDTIENVTPVFNKSPLATLLHMADMMATYLDERNE